MNTLKTSSRRKHLSINLKINNSNQAQYNLKSHYNFSPPFQSRNDNLSISIKDPSFYHSQRILSEINVLKNIKTITKLINQTSSDDLTMKNNHKDNLKIKKILNSKSFQKTLPSLNSNIHYIQINKFDYQRIFQPKGLFRRRPFRMDNRINLQYADSSVEFDKRAIDNQQVKKIYNPYVTNKIHELQGKIIFMKGIVDFSYPSVVVKKIKEIDKSMKLKENMNKVRVYNPCEQRILTQTMRIKQRKLYLTDSINFNKK